MSESSLTPEKEAELLDFSSYWQPYKIKSKNQTFDEFNGKSWPVKKFVKTNVKVRGILHVVQLFDDVWLFVCEIISKSTNIRQLYRFIILDQIILVEKDEEDINYNIFEKYICSLLQFEEPKEIRVNVLRNRSLAKKGIPIRLTLLVNNQTAGVEGLEQITLTGDNVIRGIQTLNDRQEVDLKADSIGPWIEVETNELRYQMGKGIFVKSVSETAFKVIKSTLA